LEHAEGERDEITKWKQGKEDGEKTLGGGALARMVEENDYGNEKFRPLEHSQSDMRPATVLGGGWGEEGTRGERQTKRYPVLLEPVSTPKS